ncbi:ABC transporter ATP-binding protein [Paenibacillus montaniterrae]|uniref:ABC transporter ATP-binding protein n=1 Tax=Paenibacillus montaniterrae TaxID=429341 RepID=A0A919YIT1_9BACL|nr:ABC transporter ATP-binding protein [Paenibacillus montaniterrae]GIP14668.1 ABC transporter ATP-binding protein [Paenibacillus montaniterrae]
MIQLQQLTFQYGARSIVDRLDYTFAGNAIYGIIGPNGAGKSTLLQLIAGVRKPSSGQVLLEQRPIGELPRRQLAQRIAVLQQGGLPTLGFTVKEVVAMGRFPYQNWLGSERADATALIDEAIEATGLTHLANRTLEQLSGGERQRAALAKVFVQQPDILLLDEPTTYLDIGYQQMIMELVKQWQRKQQLLVIAVMHDLNIAALYCDQLLALRGGSIIAAGTAEQVLIPEHIASLYEVEALMVNHPQQNVPQLLLRLDLDKEN